VFVGVSVGSAVGVETGVETGVDTGVCVGVTVEPGAPVGELFSKSIVTTGVEVTGGAVTGAAVSAGGAVVPVEPAGDCEAVCVGSPPVVTRFGC